MKKISLMLASMCLAVSGIAFADGHGDHKDGPKMRDCSKIENADRKAACEKRQAAMKECSAKDTKEARHACMKEKFPNMGKGDGKGEGKGKPEGK